MLQRLTPASAPPESSGHLSHPVASWAGPQPGAGVLFWLLPFPLLCRGWNPRPLWGGCRGERSHQPGEVRDRGGLHLVGTCAQVCGHLCVCWWKGPGKNQRAFPVPRPGPVPHRGRWAGVSGPSSARPAGTWSTNSRQEGPLGRLSPGLRLVGACPDPRVSASGPGDSSPLPFLFRQSGAGVSWSTPEGHSL